MKVVIFTCDKYSWLMPTFLHFYRKNWPDNPYQTEIVTETEASSYGKDIPHTMDYPVFYAGKLSWTDIAIKYLKQLKEETFLMFLDDYIITDPIDTSMVKRAEGLCVGDVGCVRLNPHDSWGNLLVDAKIESFKEYPISNPYSVSLQAAIWQREFFLGFLRKGENIWQVEIEGSKRIHDSGKRVIWADTPAINYRPGGYMRKGKVVKQVGQWVRENW